MSVRTSHSSGLLSIMFSEGCETRSYPLEPSQVFASLTHRLNFPPSFHFHHQLQKPASHLPLSCHLDYHSRTPKTSVIYLYQAYQTGI